MYDFEKVLLKPSIEPLDTNTQRIRRNLIITSVITFILVYASNGIDNDKSSFAGIKFTNLEPDYIAALLILSLGYFLLHFIWAASDHLKENTLRLTGVAIPMASQGMMFTGINTLHPNTDQKKHSSIFSWWTEQRNKVDNINQVLDEVRAKAELGNLKDSLSKIDAEIIKINHTASYLNEAITRMEKGFWKFQRSQLIRWVLLDFSIPVLMGILSFIAALLKVTTP